MRKQSLSIAGAVFVTLALCASTSQASIIVFQGQDDGAPTTGPFPNSDAAQASFETAAAAFGSTNTITYENLALGYYNNLIAAAAGVSIALTGSDGGAGLSGISNTTLGNVYGFNTTTGGANWLGFGDGTATFTFATPTNSFGTFLTGLQTFYTAQGVLTITFNDGTTETLTPTVNVNGGAVHFWLHRYVGVFQRNDQ